MTTRLQTAGFSTVLDHLRRTLPPPDRADWSDSLLLQRFLAHRDEAAFAALVQRHGNLVMSVCIRVLRNAHDSEEVFQAVFFILARKARSVIKQETLANWLYTVAVRTAMAARAAKERRHKREVQMRDLPHPEIKPEESRDWLPLLDRELSLLPKKYQTLVVLCDLEGIPRKEVARRLKLNEGTLSSRLARARRLLASRLSRYGLTLSGGVLAAGLAQNTASAKVTISLVWSTAKAATLIAAGQFVGVSAPAVVLMKGAMKSMFLAKLKTVIGTSIVALAISVGGLVYNAELIPGGARAAEGDKPKTELEALRKEVDLLRINLEVTLEKIKAQEAELRTLRGKVAKVVTPRFQLAEVHIADAESFFTTAVLTETSVKYDPVTEVEAAVKAWQNAKDKESRQKAANLLEKALKKMKEHADRVPESHKQPLKP
ncbi:MAG: RNA polymerase sigma factor [Gemmataceae bacterium]